MCYHPGSLLRDPRRGSIMGYLCTVIIGTIIIQAEGTTSLPGARGRMDWFVIHLHISITWGELEKMLGPCPRPTNSSSLGRAQASEFGKSPPQFFCADTHGDPWPTGVQYLALPQNKGVLPAHGTAQCLRALWHRLSHLIRVRAAQSCPQLFLRFYIGG